MTKQNKRGNKTLILLASLYLLPACIYVMFSYTYYILRNTAVNSILGVIMYLIPLIALAGVILYRNSADTPRPARLLSVLIALAILNGINILIFIDWMPAGLADSRITTLAMSLTWSVFLYFTFILAPVLSFAVPKIRTGRKRKILSYALKAFSAAGILYLIYFIFRSIFAGGYDTLIPGVQGVGLPWYLSNQLSFILGGLWSVGAVICGLLIIRSHDRAGNAGDEEEE